MYDDMLVYSDGDEVRIGDEVVWMHPIAPDRHQAHGVITAVMVNAAGAHAEIEGRFYPLDEVARLTEPIYLQPID